MSPGAVVDPFQQQRLQQLLEGTPLAPLSEFASTNFWHSLRHGKTEEWLRLLAAAPRPQASSVELQQRVRIGSASDLNSAQQTQLFDDLRSLIPWRKGPFELFGIHLDTEWRSDWKWLRLLGHISPLAGRTVLDVGCGSGYHCLRMLGAGAPLVIGVEPHLPYVMQFTHIKQFVPTLAAFVLPVTLERMPAALHAFDTVFSMGVLYHRRSPLDHLLELKSALRKKGELVLETLVVEAPLEKDAGYALTPTDRYCRMANVWFIPTCATVTTWLQRCGFTNIRLVDVSTTTSAEQRATQWMPWQSLSDGLSADDSSITIEGLPAPRRAIFIAESTG